MQCQDGAAILPGGLSIYVEDQWIDSLLNDLAECIYLNWTTTGTRIPTIVEDINFHTQQLPTSLGD